MSLWVILGLLPVAWLGLVLLNLLLCPRLAATGPSKGLPKLSVLVPARNAALTVGPSVQSLIGQSYPEFELILLDDHSTDGTGRIAVAAAAGSDRFRRLRGRPLPEGWSGKSWACHQLAEAARGEFLLYLSANTLASPGLLSRLVVTAQASRADLLSGVPRWRATSVGARLIQAQMALRIALVLPLPLVPRRNHASLVAATEACLLIRRETYRRIGGHAAVRRSASDGVSLARLTKRGRGRVLFCNLADGLESWVERTLGRALPFSLGLWGLPITALQILLFLVPLGALLHGLTAGMTHDDRVALAGGSIAGLAIGLGLARYFRLPVWLGLLVPLQAILSLVATVVAIWRGVRGLRRPAKGRRYA